jgi:hypothetical protein
LFFKIICDKIEKVVQLENFPNCITLFHLEI